LLYGLRTALHEARARKTPVRKEGLRLKSDGRFRDVTIEVVPLTPAGGHAHFLVLFEDHTRAGGGAAGPSVETRGEARGKAKGKGAKAGRGAGDRSRVAQLEEELAASRDYLQAIIQDLEAANEELQSANEEILSSNEELQSTNEELDTAREELQSTNEELNTLNEELHGRNEELSRANGDLLNLLANVQLAIVMVDSRLRVRRFTPMAEKLLNLIPTDVGRKISDINPNVDAPDLEGLIMESIDTVSVRERDVRDRDGRRYALRVRPYKNLEHRIDGAVIALIDVDDARQNHDNARRADERAVAASERRDYAEAVIETVREPLMVLEPDRTIRTVNRAFRDTFDLRGEEVAGMSLGEVLEGYFTTPPFEELLRRVLASDSVENFRVEQDFPHVGRRVLLINARRVDAEGIDAGLPPLILLALADVTGKEKDDEVTR
jgi:two-component system CheB/CheR fusion protein